MQSPFLHLCKSFTSSSPLSCHNHNICFGFHNALLSPSICNFQRRNNVNGRKIVAQGSRLNDGNSRPAGNKGKVTLKGNKENIWSVDNEMAEKDKRKVKPKGRKSGKRLGGGRKGKFGRVLVSGTMLIESETEPVIKPVWRTFASSVSGIWKGVGAVFSPITGEMEPIEIGKKNESLYDCYTLSKIEALPSPSSGANTESEIQRKINWVTLNPHGECSESKDEVFVDQSGVDSRLPKFESFNLKASDVMEEDSMVDAPGLVYFEDGSYSRGPVTIPVGEMSESNYYLTPTFKFEQVCLYFCFLRFLKLRVVHTIEFANGGADIQIMRVGVYEELWVSPSNYEEQSDNDTPLELKPFSQRKRTQPSELTGSWKVFEVNATPLYGEEAEFEQPGESTPVVYLCTEALKRRNLPETLVSFGEEEMIDMQDVSVMWLPGGVSAYVDVKKDGVLCIGVGWYSDEGINLVMERDYGLDGNLKEVRSKSEMKRRWTEEPK
ncbi:unnamed protein product [Arabidopsis thaliana]|uniref:(thale cress) hypothetical protein n=1 Tax=Arabidopsis thaliana TaxID=3702 RepID=A0A7G2EKF9_ARATH|nr:unnamed protein product [Arabidopsis thaliana]